MPWTDALRLCRRLSRLVLAAVLDDVVVHQTVLPTVRTHAHAPRWVFLALS
jgi:hypothetical protein